MIKLGKYLVFDKSRNLAWYNNTIGLAGTWSESLASMAALQAMTLIDGVSVTLEWNVATIDEARWLDFTQQNTRDFFVATYQAAD